MKRPDKVPLPNPLQELAEKLIKTVWPRMPAEALAIDVAEILPILTASVGTLLQAERAAMVKLGSEYIRGHWGDSDMVADAMLKELTVPADASALSAVVQRETAKLREHLKWAIVTNRPVNDGRYDSTWNARLLRCRTCNAEALGVPAFPFEHRPDCKYAAALEAAK